MRRQRLGELDAVITGGTDGDGSGEGPVVVLLHGFGAPGDDLVPLWRALDAPRGTRWVFPAAPNELPLGGGARAWWMIDMVAMDAAMRAGRMDELAQRHPAGLHEAREAVDTVLDAVERELAPSALVLGGFSQGAMLALDVALAGTRPIAGVVLMSGTLLAADEWVPRMEARRGLRVFQSHGTLDPLLPFSLAERLRDHMRDAGLAVSFVPFRDGHTIPGSVLDELGRFLTSGA